MASSSAIAATHEVYGKAGFLGAGLGYSYGISEKFTLRGDVTTAGSFSKNGTSSDFDYKAKLRNNVGTIYGDWFPMNNGFRLTAGLGVRDTRITADGRANSSGEVTIGDATIAYGGDDTAHARVKYPSVTPYLGIGWGHNVGQQAQAGWGFVADLGVYFGKPKVDFNVSDSVRTKLNAATNGNAQAEINKQEDEIKDKVEKYKVIPVIYLGASYRF
ncbi:MAG TPA: hypothetical protein VIP51_09655 [Eoetvoesiella sp.]